MIISRLYGGLGNQMFQYAFGRSLAIRNNCELKLDISDFRTYKLHPYSLSVFAISGTIATDEECDVLKYRKVSLLESAARKILGKKRKQADSHYIEKSFRFDSEAASLKDGYYLDGYWQSEKYFSDISDIIRKEFTLKNEMNQKNRQVYELIRSCNSVSLHIRRGTMFLIPRQGNITAWT